MRFYVLRTSPVQPIALQRTPGFKAMRPEGLVERGPVEPDGMRDLPVGGTVDVLLVSARLDRGAARGRRGAASARCGGPARTSAVAPAAHPGEIRTLMLTDLRWARAARRAAVDALGRLSGDAAALGDLLHHHRRAAVAAAGRDPLRCRRRGQPPRPPRAVAAPAGAPPAAPGAAAAALQRGCARGGRRRGGRERAIRRAESRPRRVPLGDRRLSAGRGRARAGRRRLAARASSRASGARHRRDHLCRQPPQEGLDRVLAAWRRVRRPGERLVVAGVDRAELRAERDRGARRGHRGRGHARPSATTAHCCAARACSSARPAARTTASPSSRRWPRDACWSPPPRPAPTPRCRSLARSTPGSSARTSAPRCAARSTRPPATTTRARAAGLLAPFSRAAVDRIVAEELLPRLLGG